MGYDRIWIKTSDLAQDWMERRQAKVKNLNEEFARHYRCLREQGNFVVLVAGEHVCFDEIFFWDTDSVLMELYEHKFKDWESIIGDAEEGCGLQAVSMYQAGRLKATKAVEPSTRKEVVHE